MEFRARPLHACRWRIAEAEIAPAFERAGSPYYSSPLSPGALVETLQSTCTAARLIALKIVGIAGVCLPVRSNPLNDAEACCSVTCAALTVCASVQRDPGAERAGPCQPGGSRLQLLHHHRLLLPLCHHERRGRKDAASWNHIRSAFSGLESGLSPGRHGPRAPAMPSAALECTSLCRRCQGRLQWTCLSNGSHMPI